MAPMPPLLPPAIPSGHARSHQTSHRHITHGGDLQGLNVLNLSAGALKLLGLNSFPDKEKR